MLLQAENSNSVHSLFQAQEAAGNIKQVFYVIGTSLLICQTNVNASTPLLIHTFNVFGMPTV